MSLPDDQQREKESVRAVCRGTRGKAFLALMHELFDHPAAHHDSALFLAYRNGQRSVVEYIEDQLRD